MYTINTENELFEIFKKYEQKVYGFLYTKTIFML